MWCRSSGISTLLQRMEREFVAVAVDGSVFKRHPRIAALMNKYIALLAPARPVSHIILLLPMLYTALLNCFVNVTEEISMSSKQKSKTPLR